MSEVEAALTKWISEVKMLERQFGEKVCDKMKIAIMTSMLPPIIQDFVYQNVTRDMLFENLLEKIGVWVGKSCRHERRVTPMDAGEVGWSDDNESEEHVGAVGAWSRCGRCDGWEHFARDCPCKGKGKWDFGKFGGKGKHNGNSNSKGGYKGDGKNNQYKGDGKGGKGQKVGGKGYQGTCWRCGMVGHKANECTK